MNTPQTKKVNAVIVGAGTIGAATAWHLARKGFDKVILIDRNQVGTGNTSKAASLMTLVRTKEAMIPLIQETYRNIDEIERITGESVGKKRVGTVHIAASEESLMNLVDLARIADSHAIRNRYIDTDELKRLVPWFDSSQALKASFMEDDSYVDAYVLAKIFADAAKVAGVHVMQNTEVFEILNENGIITGLRTDKGFIESPVVIDAAGAWANLLSVPLDVPIPMAPVRSIYWITEKNERLFPKDHPMVVLPDAMAYTRPEAGALLFGLREENSPHFHPDDLNKEPNTDFLGNPDDKWDIVMRYGQEFASYFPEFEKLGISNCITGVSTYTPDGFYTFGPVDNQEGFYVAAGCAGAGVAGSGGIGRMLAEMVFKERTFANPDPFRPDRFGSFDPFSMQFRQRCADARSKKKDGG